MGTVAQAGLPLNDADRAKALSFSQSTISMPERNAWPL
jgi:hypothetical protein